MNEQINGLWWQARIGYNNQNCDPEVIAKFAELLFNEVANAAVVSDGMFNGNERRLSVELRLGDMVKKISVFGVEE